VCGSAAGIAHILDDRLQPVYQFQKWLVDNDLMDKPGTVLLSGPCPSLPDDNVSLAHAVTPKSTSGFGNCSFESTAPNQGTSTSAFGKGLKPNIQVKRKHLGRYLWH